MDALNLLINQTYSNELAYDYASNGELDKLKELAATEIDNSSEIKKLNWNWQKESNGFTALFVACENGHELVVDYFLSHPLIDPNIANTNEHTPFLHACYSGNIKIVQRMLLDPRVDVNMPDEFNNTPFAKACNEGHDAVVKLLLEDPRVDINRAQDQGITPFYTACLNGHLKVVQLILKAKTRVEINQSYLDESTPFYSACHRGHDEIVKLLLEDPRVEINQPDRDGTTPFSAACERRHLKIVQRLMRNARVDVNQPDEKGCTPFYLMCQVAAVDMVRLLLTDGKVDIKQRNEDGAYPLFVVAENGYLEVLHRILLSGRDIDLKMKDNVNNRTAAEQGRAMANREMLPDESQEEHERKLVQGPIIADLLDEFERDPVLTRKKITQLYAAELAASLFALVIFHTDGFMDFAEQPPLDAQDVQRYQRFFTIAKRLPLELQMILCNRAFGGSKDIVSSKDSEGPFWNLAQNQLMWFPK